MRRRRKASSPADELRRLALAERWDELRELLARRLARDPEDAEARSELERLNQGLPLRATESALTRRRREEREMQEELAAELAHYRSNPDMLAEWDDDLRERRRRRVASIRSTLGSRMSSDLQAESAAYLAALNSLCASGRSRRRRRMLLFTSLPLLLLLAVATVCTLHQRAAKAEDALREALATQNPAKVDYTLRLADSGLNRHMDSSLAELIYRARRWQANLRRDENMLREELAALESGKGSILALPLLRRARLEEALRSLPDSMQDLRERWDLLKDKEQSALASQGGEILQRFLAPLPELPPLSGKLAEDEAQVREHLTMLRQHAREWEAARSIYGFSEPVGEHIRAQLEDAQRLLEDISFLRRSMALLPSARSYARYRELLGTHEPTLYAPALRLADIRQRLPQEDKLRELMQDHGRQLPAGMLEAASRALLEGGPSFTPAFPANARQLQLMEDIFTYKGLQKVLYEMSAATLPSVIVEERPVVTEESASFTPSPLSPGYSLDVPRRITWHNPQAVYIRRIDASPLLRQTGIARETFFSSTNLPSLLGALLRVENAECPELARAFVFKRLLELMQAHEWPTMLGIAYAPTLRADARSFFALTRRLGFPLEAGCWLLSNEQTRQAEEACAQWFRERRHRDYAAEIARNFRALVQVHPRYVGYVDDGGSPRLCRLLPEGSLLWYLSESGLTTSPFGEELESPVPWSPVFTVAKD